MSNYLLGYTREPISNVLYDPKLAYSLHLAISEDGTHFKGLNHNSGVLFALATENEDGSLNPMSLKNPWIQQRADGLFAVLAVRTLGDGESDASSLGQVLYWTTEDFLVYREEGLITLDNEEIERAICLYDTEKKCYHLLWETVSGAKKQCDVTDLTAGMRVLGEEGFATEPATKPQVETCCMGGAHVCNIIEIPDAVADRLCKKLLTPENCGLEFPEEITVNSEADLSKLRAVARYTDGGTDKKRIDWNLEGIDFSKAGRYEIAGRVRRDHYGFPVAFNRADPCIGKWKGKYYFISTNDADNSHTLYAREADTIPELLNAQDHLVLDAYTYPQVGNLLWAPEFHEINGKLYIFHAATPEPFFEEESHVMELKEGGNPVCKEDWSEPRRVVRADGSQLCEAGKTITLDMTAFEWQGQWYAIWSQRQFLPKDLGAWLYIAKLNPDKPWMLASDPVVLSKPDYGWANNHTFVDEGPFMVPVEDKLYITFSSAAVDTSYVVGYLVIEKDKDLLIRENWHKNNYPILTSRSVSGEYGTGHNAYVTDEDGHIWNTYHARPGVEGVRSSGIRRVYLDVDGAPMLDVTEELDLSEEYREVHTVLNIVKK